MFIFCCHDKESKFSLKKHLRDSLKSWQSSNRFPVEWVTVLISANAETGRRDKIIKPIKINRFIEFTPYLLLTMHCPLPEYFQPELSIGCKSLVLRDEGQFVGDGLPDNQAVKRVFVFHARQVVEGGSVCRGNGQYVKT